MGGVMLLRKEKYNCEEDPHCREAVTAILKTRSDLERVMEALKDRGFRPTDITVMMSTIKGQHEMGFEKVTKAYKGAAVGGIVGLVIGLLHGWMATNQIVIFPGTEFVMDRAPWLIVATSSVYGILLGAIIGLLIGMKFPEYVVRLYEKSIRGGSMLISVRVDNPQWKTRAMDILKFHRVQPITTKKN